MSTKTKAKDDAKSEALTKEQLERQMEEARDSLSQTVKEIKETVTDQYEAVRGTVSGVLDYREQFQKEPVVWSLGALSAGFALGYTLGYAHKNTKASKRKHAQLSAFADSLAGELSTVGKTLVMPALNQKIKELFGFDFSEVLQDMSRTHSPKSRQKRTKLLPKKAARRSSSSQRKKKAVK